MDPLGIDIDATLASLTDFIRRAVVRDLRRRGAVVGISGGVDSAVVAALCARALGPDKVLGLLMPERDSSGDSLRLGRMVAEAAGVPVLVEDVGPALEAIGCYRRQEEAVRTVFPAYGRGWKCKLALPPVLESDRLNVTRLVVQTPQGERLEARLGADAYRLLVAATNFKQRIRKAVEYHHADRLHYAVAGTPNRLEWDQGFFVKQGDGDADFKPIAHLYKTQVYALAEALGVPAEVRTRPPTTDTYSLAQTQEEFYFALPPAQLDVCLWGVDHAVPAEDTARRLGVQPEQVKRAYRDIESKRRASAYQHLAPLMAEPV